MADIKMDVRVYPIDEPQGSTKAFASVALDDMVAIRGIRVIEGEKGLFVSMPQSSREKDGKTEYHDIAFPLDSGLRNDLNKAVKEEYTRVSALPAEQRGYDKPEAGAMNGLSVEEIKLDIKVFPLKDSQTNTKAFASINIDDLVEIRGVRVVEGSQGLFVTMPQSQDKKTNDYHDVAFPTNGDLRKEITKAVLEKYENGDKSKDKSLADGLKKGAEKAAGHTAAPRDSAAKSKASAIE
jgi:stage V sporulation protein G